MLFPPVLRVCWFPSLGMSGLACCDEPQSEVAELHGQVWGPSRGRSCFAWSKSVSDLLQSPAATVRQSFFD